MFQVNYGATSSVLSNKLHYPSLVRTIPSNKNLIEMIIHIIRWFGWNWVAFLGSQDNYSSDGLKLFNEYITNTGICLAYQESLSLNTNYSLTLRKIETLNINVVVVFAVPKYAREMIKAAISNNIQNKVWIASEAWAMNQQLPREPGIWKIGTIIGITERLLSLPGFDEFVYKDRRTTDVIHDEGSDIQSTSKTCNQVCDYCTLLTAEEIINENPTLSFAIYAAIYTVAHALHKVLQCDMNECNKNTAIKPYMVPFSNCSAECKEGFSRQPEGFHSCCFTCKKCPRNSYVNYSRNPYTCFPCAESEWYDESIKMCKTRSVVYLQFTEIPSIAVLVCALCIIILLIAIFCIFAYNYDTPVVRSAGGNMCFLMLTSLILSSIGSFFFFGKPTFARCLLRNSIFAFFFTLCVSCLTVRSFQIVCVFKMAAQFPKVHSFWVKHNGQWLFVVFASVIHLISCVIWMTVSPVKVTADSWTYIDQIMLICERGNPVTLTIVVFLGWFLGFLCLLFSYMGRDLPKNYNEAKSITFSLILYYLTWIVYFTAYVSFKSKYIVLLNAMAQLSSINGILFSYFIPKSYVILFQPQKNTPAYFQTTIQNYTQTISRT